MSLVDKFIENVEFGKSCWLWVGRRNEQGYGILSAPSRTAHRFSYELFKEPIGKGLCVCHTCDTPSCVNPSHLFTGTRADNNRDRDLKGRTARGAKHGRTKLTQAQAEQIRFLKNSNLFTNRQIAKLYNVSSGAISGILTGRAWK